MSCFLAIRPGCNLRAGGGKRPIADGQHHLRFLGEGNEFAWQYDAARGVLPADERFHARHTPLLHLRLIVKQELIRLDRLMQFYLERGAGVDGFLQGGREEAHGVAARRLRLVQGDIGLLQDGFGGLLMVSEEADSDAGARMAFAAIQQIGMADDGEYSFRDAPGLCRGILRNLIQIFEHDRELIRSQPRHGVGFVDTAGDAPRNLLQQKIARAMAKGVVHRLEVIQINVEQSLLAVADCVGGHGLLQAVQQQAPVGQAGQGIMEREIFDSLFRLPYLGGIAGDG